MTWYPEPEVRDIYSVAFPGAGRDPLRRWMAAFGKAKQKF
jgi:hypothetical protein